MENINFIPANNLPVAEGDEVSVLCLENGEMKQKPANGLGGGTMYDLSIRLHPTGLTDGNLVFENEILSGSYDAVVEKINNGVAPKVLVIEDASNMGEITDGDQSSSKAVIESNVALYLEDEPCVIGWGWMFQWRVLPDGTVEAAW